MDQLTVSTGRRGGPEKGLLRFLTCGSVDDGKSTLIGRLLYDTKLILEDQLAALKRDSRKHGTTGDDMDFAAARSMASRQASAGEDDRRGLPVLLDAAARFHRRGYARDTSSTRATWPRVPRTRDAAVILIRCAQGRLLTQTRRHSYICSLLGIRHVLLAVNKIDLVDFSGERFHHIVGDYLGFAQALSFTSITPIPVSARFGDNVTTHSQRMSWYDGPTLLEHLEDLDATEGLEGKPFRFPVQWVNRPDLDFRGFSGTVAIGRRCGTAIKRGRSRLRDAAIDRRAHHYRRTEIWPKRPRPICHHRDPER